MFEKFLRRVRWNVAGIVRAPSMPLKLSALASSTFYEPRVNMCVRTRGIPVSSCSFFSSFSVEELPLPARASNCSPGGPELVLPYFPRGPPDTLGAPNGRVTKDAPLWLAWLHCTLFSIAPLSLSIPTGRTRLHGAQMIYCAACHRTVFLSHASLLAFSFLSLSMDRPPVVLVFMHSQPTCYIHLRRVRLFLIIFLVLYHTIVVQLRLSLSVQQEGVGEEREFYFCSLWMKANML